MLTAILLAAAANPVPIEVGRFDEADFPQAKRVEVRMSEGDLNYRVDKILARGQCQLAGQSKTRFNFKVPYAVLMQASGEASRVVVKDIGCAPIETLVGQVGQLLGKAGGFKPAHQQGERWYVSEVHFALGGEEMARTEEDPNKVVCQAAKPRIGSRVAMNKVCRTVQEWKLFGVDREQYRRDLQHKGMSPSSQ